MKILVTGGAGFIGSHLVDKLIEKKHDVSILDNLISTNGAVPEYLNKNAEFIQGDIRDKTLLKKIIPEFEVIFHKAASVGIAQSNYEIGNFTDNNCLGTARLLESIVEFGKKPKLIISSSNTSYGEGICLCEDHGKFHPKIRTSSQIKENGFEPVCFKCKCPGKPFPTPETTELDCNSIYAINKKNQEEMALFLGKLYEFPVVSLRYFNVFGPRQSLSNPYTGVSAIFMSRVKNNNPPVIYEDGLQTRDFIYIDDIVNANILAMEKSSANNHIFNVGSGNPVSIKKLAEKICEIYGKSPKIEINGKFRKGDIRNCIADNSKIQKMLDWKPNVSFDEGLRNIYEWSKNQLFKDDFEKANSELKNKGLLLD